MGAKVKEAAMTGGEELIERGFQKGMQKGRDEGSRGTFILVIRHRFGALPPSAEERIQAASAADIERWIASLETSRSIDELLGS